MTKEEFVKKWTPCYFPRFSPAEKDKNEIVKDLDAVVDEERQRFTGLEDGDIFGLIKKMQNYLVMKTLHDTMDEKEEELKTSTTEPNSDQE